MTSPREALPTSTHPTVRKLRYERYDLLPTEAKEIVELFSPVRQAVAAVIPANQLKSRRSERYRSLSSAVASLTVGDIRVKVDIASYGHSMSTGFTIADGERAVQFKECDDVDAFFGDYRIDVTSDPKIVAGLGDRIFHFYGADPLNTAGVTVNHDPNRISDLYTSNSAQTQRGNETVETEYDAAFAGDIRVVLDAARVMLDKLTAITPAQQ